MVHDSRPAPSAPARCAAPSRIAARLAAAIALLAALMLSGCARNSPRGVAQRYVDNLKKTNYAGCYAMLTDQDRNDRALAQFLNEIPLAPDADPIWFRPVLDHINFTLGDAQIDGDHATVPVRITMPDLPVWERMLDASAGADRSGADLAAASLAASRFPIIEVDDQIVLLKQHRHWHIVAGFAVRDRAADLDRDAIVAFHRHDYPTAIARYHAIAAQLAQAHTTGALGMAARYQAQLAQVIAVQAESASSAAYAATQLVLSGVAMRMAEERVPAIFGTITNRGDRPLDDVDLTVTWYTGRGKDLKAVYSEDHPIVATPYEFTDFSRPVIPFIPGQSRPFGFILNAPVEVQQDAAPYVTVGAVAFTHSIAPLPKTIALATPAATAAAAPVPSAALSPAAGFPPGVAVPKAPPPPSGHRRH